MFALLSKNLAAFTKIPEQLIRFLIIGTINTAIAYGLYAVFIFIGFHYTTAVFFSTAIGVCVSFKTFGKWVFFQTDNRRIFRFLAVYTVGYFLNVGILKLCTAGGLFNLYLAGFISSIAVAGFSFAANKYFVFKR